MNTKQIPAIVMLLAGFVTCIVAIFQGMELGRFLKFLFAVLIGVYIAGCIIKVILDKNFKEPDNQKEAETEETQEGQPGEETAKEGETKEAGSTEQTHE